MSPLRRNWCPWSRHALGAACVVLNALSGATAAEPAPTPPDAPRRGAAGSDAPVNIFLGDPADLNAVWKALTAPDFVILRGDEY
ncbi:MAG: hypothetical protein LC745_06665, partial [Planctomycetia bacterium]|nr:hypothetical protein [Planctomycetia bacterium]